MSRLPLFFLAALPFVESPALAAGPVAPEPAPSAQRQAPPDKIAPPMQVKSPTKPETTGDAAKELKPGDDQNTRIDQSMPSSPPAANKCPPGNKQERGPDGTRCP